jgi:hypothetical protein
VSIALFAFERPDQATRAAEALKQVGLPANDVTLHLPHDSRADRAAAAVDEQVTGGLLTNLAGLFGEVFEWGGIPIDASPYAAAVRRGGAVVGVYATASQRPSVDELMAGVRPSTSSGWFDLPGEMAADAPR